MSDNFPQYALRVRGLPENSGVPILALGLKLVMALAVRDESSISASLPAISIVDRKYPPLFEEIGGTVADGVAKLGYQRDRDR